MVACIKILERKSVIVFYMDVRVCLMDILFYLNKNSEDIALGRDLFST